MQVGVIERLARYAVKSMRGEAVPVATLTLQGLEGDRRHAFVQATSRSSFPWLTSRELPEMLCYKTSAEGSGSAAVVMVTAPGGEKWRVESDELRQLLEARSGRALFLLHDYRGSYDVAQVSIISRQTVARIAEESATVEDPWRFRPNLLVDLENGKAYDEAKWVGRILRVGDTARVAVTEVDQRCVMITLDPDGGEASPSVLRCVAQQHKSCAGVYGMVLTPGEVRARDPIEIEG